MSLLGKIGKAFKKAMPLISTAAMFIPGGQAVGMLGKGLALASRVSRVASIAGAVAGRSRIPTAIGGTMAGFPSFGVGGGHGAAGYGRIMALGGGAGALIKTGGGLIRSLPGAGRVGAIAGGAMAAGRGLVQRFPRSAKALRDLGLVASGGLVFDQAGNVVGRVNPSRRINPLNHRAARRAGRRIKAVMKLCRSIESSLPKRRSQAPCPPSFARRRK